MKRLRFNIPDELMREIADEADLLWPGHGVIAVKRLVRDSLRRLWSYCNGNGRVRRRSG
ncbi:hypothetical protein ACFLWX_01640 [Chloroflexota bacterium]